MIAFCDGMCGWLDERRAANVVYLNFSKAFDAVSPNIFISRFGKCELHEHSVRWIEIWLKDRAQRAVIHGPV